MPILVQAEDLERELDRVRAEAAGPVAGLFGPGSLTWRVDREAIIFLGAGRALLLQLAHPWVAAAIAEHSQTLADPIGRFHRTFDAVFTMVFGSLDQAFAAARRLHRRHGSISGVLSAQAGPRERQTAERALAWIRRTHQLQLARLRYVGPYQEAVARLSGRPRPDLATRWLNRLWIGRAAMRR